MRSFRIAFAISRSKRHGGTMAVVDHGLAIEKLKQRGCEARASFPDSHLCRIGKHYGCTRLTCHCKCHNNEVKQCK
jgi:hypothetical protein